MILICQQEKRFRRAGVVVSRYEFNRKKMVTIICPITSTVKKYSFDILFLKIWIPTDNLLFLNWRHQISKKTKKIENLLLKDMSKIDQVIEYIF